MPPPPPPQEFGVQLLCSTRTFCRKYAVHEKTKNKEKTERKNLVHQTKGNRYDVTELKNNKQRPSKHHSAKRRTKAQRRTMFIPYRRNKTSKHRRMLQHINRQNVHFLIDTGATVDIIDSNTFEKLNKKVSLQKSLTKIYAYGFQIPLPLKGQFQATLEAKKRYTVSQIYVIDGAGGNLLSAKTAQDLALVQLANKFSSFPEQDQQTDHHTHTTTHNT